MGHIHAIQIPDNTTHLIEPLLYSTTSGTSNAITANIPNFELAAGVTIALHITTTNTNGATLSINGGTANSIYYNGSTISANILKADYIYHLVYDGTVWHVIGFTDSWTSPQKVKVDLSTTYGTETGQNESEINGGQNSVQEIAVDGTLDISHGGTGISSIGNTGEILKVNSLGTALEWSADVDENVVQDLDDETNSTYPVLFSDETTTSTVDSITSGTKRNNSVHINPSTGTLSATELVGGGTGISSLSSTAIINALGTNSIDDIGGADKNEAIKDITRSGTTFTVTRCDDTTFSFDQQDNNTTYDMATDVLAGLVSTVDQTFAGSKTVIEDINIKNNNVDITAQNNDISSTSTKNVYIRDQNNKAYSVLRGSAYTSGKTGVSIGTRSWNSTNNTYYDWNYINIIQSNQGVNSYQVASPDKFREAISTPSTSEVINSITRSGTTFTATRADGTTFSFDQQDNNTTYTLDGLGGAKKTEAIKSISRSGTTYTATRCDGTTFTFNQQDNNTTYALITTNNSTVGLDPSNNHIGYISGLTKAAWNSQQTDGALYGQFYSASWKHQIYGDYRTGHIAVRGKNNGTWADWKLVLDTGNYDSYAAKKVEAIKTISRSGTTFTATRCDGTTFTFNQQDNNTTYSLAGLGGAAKTEAIKNITRSGVKFTITRCDNTTFTFNQQDNNNTYDLAGLGGAKASEAIKSITRSGVTFTATRCNGTTFTFNQQDSNSTYSLATLGGAAATEAIKSISRSGVTFTATRCNGTTFTFNQQDNNSTYSLATLGGAAASEAIKSISRSGVTFTATRCNGTTFTFNQQDNNTTYSLAGLGGAAASEAIKSITRSGVTFTATRCNNTTFTFNQQDNNNTYDLSTCVKTTGNWSMAGVISFTNTTASSSTATGAVKLSGGLGCAKYIYGARVYGAYWNDYAEYRKVEKVEPGRCVTETESGIMTQTTKRLMSACRIVSDTYGFGIGESDDAKTPIAVSGRVLAYPYKDRNQYHLGDAVCSAPNGTIDIMTRREIRKYPERIIGIVSEIPSYEEWCGGTNENPEPVKVNGRIWVYVR